MGSRQDAICRGYEHFNTGDLSGAVSHLHPEVEWIEPDDFFAGGHYHGHAGVYEYLSQVRARWAFVQSTPVKLVEFGDHIIVLVRTRVKARPDDDPIEREIADVYTFSDEQVTRMRAYGDPREAFAAYGSSPESIEPID